MNLFGHKNETQPRTFIAQIPPDVDQKRALWGIRRGGVYTKIKVEPVRSRVGTDAGVNVTGVGPHFTPRLEILSGRPHRPALIRWFSEAGRTLRKLRS